jgi:hypothetical protein
MKQFSNCNYSTKMWCYQLPLHQLHEKKKYQLYWIMGSNITKIHVIWFRKASLKAQNVPHFVSKGKSLIDQLQSFHICSVQPRTKQLELQVKRNVDIRRLGTEVLALLPDERQRCSSYISHFVPLHPLFLRNCPSVVKYITHSCARINIL